MDIRDNPKLIMPPKVQETVKSSGAEFYNIDFDSELLREGAVVTGSKTKKSELFRGRVGNGGNIQAYRWSL